MQIDGAFNQQKTVSVAMNIAQRQHDVEIIVIAPHCGN
jgi:hypothetical protein